MKKLSLLIMLLMGFNVIASTTFAATEDDDMAALNALLNEEDTGTTDENMDTTDENMDTTDENMDTTDENMDTTDENMDTTDEKVQVQLSGTDVNSFSLVVTPIDGYTTYKVYYTKDGDNNVNEKEFTIENNEDKEVIVEDLEPNTSYTVVVKAFDEDGNPIESTTSDELTVQTKEEQHQAPADNILYNPTVKAYDNKIVVSYKPGMDVKKVQISISDDGQSFKPVAVVDATTTTTYTIPVDKAGKKYIKLVPVAEDGTLGVCKVGTTDVPFLTAEVAKPEQKKKEAEKNVGKAKTGPELYFLVILAVLAYVVYARRRKA